MFDQFIANVKVQILNPLIFLFMALAAVWFLFGVLKYIRGYDNDTERQAGQRHMVWGVIGLAIMLSAFGIMRLIEDLIGVNITAIP